MLKLSAALPPMTLCQCRRRHPDSSKSAVITAAAFREAERGSTADSRAAPVITSTFAVESSSEISSASRVAWASGQHLPQIRAPA
jgi:hypothetical protein